MDTCKSDLINHFEFQENLSSYQTNSLSRLASFVRFVNEDVGGRGTRGRGTRGRGTRGRGTRGRGTRGRGTRGRGTRGRGTRGRGTRGRDKQITPDICAEFVEYKFWWSRESYYGRARRA